MTDTSANPPSESEVFDCIVVGAGGAGMMAAMTAGKLKLKTLVLEKGARFGGVTAISGGALWVPNSTQARREGIQDSIDAARRYIRTLAGNQFNSSVVDAFLRQAIGSADFIEAHTRLSFYVTPDRPDYYPQLPGASLGTRTIVPKTYDGRNLGTDIRRLREPARGLSFLGMLIKPGPELHHFYNVLKSPRSFWFVLRRLSKHFRDLALHGRSMELVSGMSLVAALAEAAFEEGVELRTSAAVESLVMDGTRVTGVRVRVGGREQIVRTRGGVILACGGFPHDVERQRKVFPHVAHGGEHKSPAPRTNTGDGIRMAERLGAYTPELSDAGAWAPCSQITWSDGQTEVFPHLIDRQKPGFIAVTRAGKRFTNESHSYHEYGRGLIAACAGQSETVSFLIGDHRTVRRYGVGVVRPWPVPLGPYLRAGYLLRGQTLAELAAVAGIDAANLQTTVQQYNQQARLGRDPEFHRGESPYNRFNGDPLQQPNPNVGPIERGPFYAVKVYVGELGTFGGLAIDERARTLRRDGTAIPGLYAAGNDISSPMAGNYAGGGTTLGPGLTFAFIAAQDIAQQLRRERDATSERTDEIVRSDRCEMAGSRE